MAQKKTSQKWEAFAIEKPLGLIKVITIGKVSQIFKPFKILVVAVNQYPILLFFSIWIMDIMPQCLFADIGFSIFIHIIDAIFFILAWIGFKDIFKYRVSVFFKLFVCHNNNKLRLKVFGKYDIP